MICIYGKGGHANMIKSNLKKRCRLFNDYDYDMSKSIITREWIIGIGDNKDREKIAKGNLQNEKFITIDRSTYNAADIIGLGVILAPGSIIQNGVKIGNHVIINTSASIDHDCIIEDFCHIAPNVTLCGAVKIGKGSFIGAGSIIIPEVTIGKNCIIGAGSVVIRNIPDNSKAYGNPAKIKS